PSRASSSRGRESWNVSRPSSVLKSCLGLAALPPPLRRDGSRMKRTFLRLTTKYNTDSQPGAEPSGERNMSRMLLSWKLGRIAGIDVYLHATFLLVLMMTGLSGGSLLMTLMVFGCVLLHELGHALMARRFGIETADITLYPIGGVARLRRLPRAPGVQL